MSFLYLSTISSDISNNSSACTTLQPFVPTPRPPITSYKGLFLHIVLHKGKRSCTTFHHISNFVS